MFAVDLVHYLDSEAQYVHTLMTMSQQDMKNIKVDQKRVTNVELALEALRNIVRSNPGKRWMFSVDARSIQVVYSIK